MQKTDRHFNTITRWETTIVLLGAGLVLLIMTKPAFRTFFFDENFECLGMYRAQGDNFWWAMWSTFGGVCFRPIAVAVSLPWHFILPTDPFVYHIRNFVFSVINLLLLHRILLRLVISRWARLLAVFFFAASKVHLTTIGYLNQYDEIMLLMLLLLTVLFFLRYFEKDRVLDYALALTFSFLSIFIKDYGLVIIPVVVALTACYGLTPKWRTQVAWRVLRLSPLLLIAFLYLWLRFAIVGPLPRDNPTFSPQFSARVIATNALAFTSAIGNLSLTGLPYTDVGATGASGLGALLGRSSRWIGSLIDGASYVLFMALLLGMLALKRRNRLGLVFPMVWIAAYFGPPLLIRNLQIYYFYVPMAGTAVLLGMCLDLSSRSLLKVWTLALVIFGVNGMISNYTSFYHWQSGAKNVERIQKPLLEAHRGEPVDDIIFVAASKPFWVWAFTFNKKAPMLAELMKRPRLRVSIFDYYELPDKQFRPSPNTLFFEIDKRLNFKEIRSLAELPNRTVTPSGPDTSNPAVIRADPNPIQVCDGSGLGVTKITYTVAEHQLMEVHVEAPDGALLARATASGTSTTGKWVSDGTIFFLQDVSGGKPPTKENTIGTVTVYLTSAGCQ